MQGHELALRYRVPAGTAMGEIEVKNSVFVGTAGHAPSVEAAHDLVARVRADYPDASHHAWAYRITGGSQGLIGSSDDGEPGGTAGRPMLAVLEGSGLCEVVVVGTRFFGGVKLGTGGLVRAYGAAAREALTSLPTVERVLHQLYTVEVDYAAYGNLAYLLPQRGVKIDEAVFADRVTLDLAVPAEESKAVEVLMRDLTSGRVRLPECWHGHRYDRHPE